MAKNYIIVEKRANLVSGDYNSHDLIKCSSLDKALLELLILTASLPLIEYTEVETITNCQTRAISPLYQVPVLFEIRITY